MFTTPVHVHDSGMVPKNNLKLNAIMEESQDKVTMHLEANLMKLTPHSFPLTSIFIFLTLEQKTIPNILNKLETSNI